MNYLKRLLGHTARIAFMCGLFVLVALFALPAKAQTFQPRRFLSGITSLNLSNTLSFTNISSRGSLGTNVAGVVWTNGSGTQVIAGTNQTTTKLLKDIDLFTDRNGTPYNQTNAATAASIIPVNSTLGVTLVGGANANTAVTFKFRPLYDGTQETTASGQLWTFTVTPNTTTTVCITTNPPLHLWPGCKAIRCVEITNPDGDASSQVTLLDLTLNGYVP